MSLMEDFKRKLRSLGLIILIILAGVGIGFFGGLPIPTRTRKTDKTEANKELEKSESNKKVMKKF